MKTKIFYVIHLDRGRILLLCILFGGFLMLSFALGQRFETKRDKNSSELFPLLSAKGSYKTPKQPAEDYEDQEESGQWEGEQLSWVDKKKLKKQSAPASASAAKAHKNKKYKKKKALSKTKPKRKESPALAHSKNIARKKPAKKKASGAKAASRTLAAKKSAAGAERLSAKVKPKSEKKREGSLRLANIVSSPERAPAKKQILKKPSYSFQLGAFRSQAAAERMYQQLKQQGFETYIHKSQQGLYIVRVAKAASLEASKALEERLRRQHYSPLRVSTQ